MGKPVKAVYQISRSVSVAKRAAVGQVCVDFAILEWAVDRSIWALKGHDRKSGRVLTQTFLTKERVRELSKAAHARFGTGSKGNKEYGELCKEITKIAKVRNLAVHGLWAKSARRGERNKSWILTYFKNPSGTATLVKRSEFYALSEDIRKLEFSLHAASLKHLGAPLP